MNPAAKSSDQAVDLAALSDEALTLLRGEVEQEIGERQKRKRTEFLASIKEQAGKLGLDIAEVAAAMGRRAAPGKRAVVQPKYRNPANPKETWSGRGQKPKWMEALIAKGSKPEDFKIEKTA